MDFNREWTQFALDAEVEHFGTGRIAKEHNALRAEVLRLREALSVISGQSVCCDARHCADRGIRQGGEAAVLRKAIERLKAREAAAKTKSKVSDDDVDRCIQSLLAGSYALAALLMDEYVQIFEAAALPNDSGNRDRGNNLQFSSEQVAGSGSPHCSLRFGEYDEQG